MTTTETITQEEVIEIAIHDIDGIIGRLSARELVATSEIVDDLLDLRQTLRQTD